MHSFSVVLALSIVTGCVWALELQDPTRPVWHLQDNPLQGSSTRNNAPHRLTMIISGPQENIAVINGRRVKSGDSVGGATVVNVNTLDVELERDGGRFAVELLPLQVKTAAEDTSKGK